VIIGTQLRAISSQYENDPMGNYRTTSPTGETQQWKAAHVPFAERPTCSISEGVEVSGLSRSLLYQKMNAGELEWVKVGSRRLLRVRSLLRLLGAE
jgi:hypothetical protein